MESFGDNLLYAFVALVLFPLFMIALVFLWAFLEAVWELLKLFLFEPIANRFRGSARAEERDAWRPEYRVARRPVERDFLTRHAGKVLAAGFILPIPMRFFDNLTVAILADCIAVTLIALAVYGFIQRRQNRERQLGQEVLVLGIIIALNIGVVVSHLSVSSSGTYRKSKQNI